MTRYQTMRNRKKHLVPTVTFKDVVVELWDILYFASLVSMHHCSLLAPQLVAHLMSEYVVPPANVTNYLPALQKIVRMNLKVIHPRAT